MAQKVIDLDGLDVFKNEIDKEIDTRVNDISPVDIGALTEIKIGTVTTGNTGSKASADTSTSGTITTLNLTIPKGDKGDKGDNATVTSVATQSVNGLMSAADKKKLDGIAASANNYSLPAASSSARGGVKIGYTANGKNYPVQLENEQMYVNVPWTDTNTDTKVSQTNTTTNAAYRVLFSNSNNDTNEAQGVGKSTNLRFNPATGALYSLGYDRTNITGATVDINTYTLAAGHPEIQRFVNKTNGGASNITNIPVTGAPFILDVELIRWASNTDYITKQTFTSVSQSAFEYVRFCTSGTWGVWTKRVFTDNNTTYGNMTAATASSAGKAGLVPAPAAGAQGKYLRGDGTWQTPPNSTYTAATAAPLAAGTASVGTSTKYAREDHVHPAQTTVSGNAGSATKLATARTINGVSFNGTSNINIDPYIEELSATGTWNIDNFNLINQKVNNVIPKHKSYVCMAHSYDYSQHGTLPEEEAWAFRLDVDLIFNANNYVIVRQDWWQEDYCHYIRYYDTYENDGWTEWKIQFTDRMPIPTISTTATTMALHKTGIGSANATTSNCPAGSWYGKY